MAETQSVCKWCAQAIHLTTTVDIPELVWVSPDGAVFCPKFGKPTGHEPVAEPASTGEPPSELWQPISTAPKNASEIRVKMRDGTIHKKAHWAEDLSGSDQPPFKGWFIPRGEDGFDGIQEPELWMPRAARPSGPSAPQRRAEPCLHCHNTHWKVIAGDGCAVQDRTIPCPHCGPQPVSGDAPGIKVTIYDPIAYLQELYADMGKRGECEICLKLQFCIEVLKEKLSGDDPKVEGCTCNPKPLNGQHWTGCPEGKVEEIVEAIDSWLVNLEVFAANADHEKRNKCHQEIVDYLRKSLRPPAAYPKRLPN